jgi:large subunit ribosomal protein L21
MYAIIDAGGRQLRVTAGETVRVDRMPGEAGDAVTFDRVLLVGGDDVQIGQPHVGGATVSGRVVGQVRGRKIVVQKYKPKNRYKVIRGHRQHYTDVAIERIDLGEAKERSKAGSKAKAKAEASPAGDAGQAE